MWSGARSYSLACAAARALPPAADDAVARLLAGLARRWRPVREEAARQNLAVLHPGWSPAARAHAARAAGTSYARFLLEFLRHHASDPRRLRRRIDLDLDAGVERALRAGRGLVVCTAHVGNWEIGAVSLAGLGLGVTVVAGPQFAPGWSEPVRRAKAQAGIRVVGSEESPRRLLRDLERGGAVCLLADGNLFARGWPARIAGRELLLANGPARLAAASGALLTGALCLRRGARFGVTMRSLGGTEEAAAGDARALHAAVAAWLEHVLLRHAAEWCVFRPFFPQRSAA